MINEFIGKFLPARCSLDIGHFYFYTMEQTFVSGSDQRKSITVKFEPPFITFTFKNGSCFYDFYIEDWHLMKPHFIQKSWVTQSMVNFINSNIS